MLGENGKPFKTRDGGTVKLTSLLDESETRAFALVTAKNPAMPETQRREIARVVGIGAVKYADLSMARTTDYVFSLDRMLSLSGNTAPYLQYAYSRIMGILRKAQSWEESAALSMTLTHPAERTLALKLLRFEETLDTVCETCCPHILCAWLYDLVGAFMKFYEFCPVLKAEAENTGSRLRLCRLTAATIENALAILGIETIEEM